jgi:hypothetical protein
MVYPNRPEEMQDMEMEPVVLGPGSYASPDPATESGRLLPLTEHPLNEEISSDYGEGAGALAAKAPADMSEEELDAKYSSEDGYPEDGTAEEKAEFAQEVEDERAAAEAEAPANMTVAELDEKYGDYEDYPASGNKAEKVQFAESVEEEA